MAQQIINTGSAPNDGTGNTLRDSFIKTNNNFTELYNNASGYTFQVSSPTSGHIHDALMTVFQSNILIQGTSLLLPVGDPLQPNVVITSSTNGTPGHSHNLTVYFDYINHTFIVTSISDNVTDNHTAEIVGGQPIPTITWPATADYLTVSNSGSVVKTVPVVVSTDISGAIFADFKNATTISAPDTFSMSLNAGLGANLNIGSSVTGRDILITAYDATFGPSPGVGGDVIILGGGSNTGTNAGGSVRIAGGYAYGTDTPNVPSGGFVLLVSGNEVNTVVQPVNRTAVIISTAAPVGEGSAGIYFNNTGAIGFGVSSGINDDPVTLQGNTLAAQYGITGQILVSRDKYTTPAWTDPILKPAPLTVTSSTFVSPVILGSADQHNSHFRSLSTTPITFIVQPESAFPGSPSNYWFDATSPMPIGGTILIGKHAAGDITIQAGAGVTINTPETLIINKLNGKVALTKVGANEWDIEGNLKPA